MIPGCEILGPENCSTTDGGSRLFVTVTAPSYQWGSGGEVHRWAHERAADGSWSSSIVRGYYGIAFVSESVLLG